MVAAFPVTTWSIQWVLKQSTKTCYMQIYRLKIAICYRNKRHLLKDRHYCPHELVLWALRHFRS
jgi:hypothetical protein